MALEVHKMQSTPVPPYAVPKISCWIEALYGTTVLRGPLRFHFDSALGE